MDADDGESEPIASTANKEKGGEKCPDFEPPQAVVNRIMKGVLPDNVQITKDARTAFARASGVFIFYLAHCANDISKEKKRSTIYASDVSVSQFCVELLICLIDFTIFSFFSFTPLS